MANVNISQLPSATSLTAADILPVVQGGITKRVTPDLLPVSTATASALAGKDPSGAAAAAQAAAVQRSNHTGTQSADTLTDGTTNKAYTATERTKLAAVAGTNTGDQTLAINGAVLTISGANGNSVTVPTGGGAATDATTTAKGVVQLAGDLAGTAAAPTVAKINGVTVTGTPTAGQSIVASSTTAASWAVPAITGQYLGSAATFTGLPTTDASGQAASNGDWAFLTADVVGTGTTTAPQYPRGAYVTNGTTYSLAVTLGADFVIGTTAGTIAAGNDTRIVGAAQTGSNLSDLANIGTARTNLGLGTAATQASTAFDAAGAATTAQAASLQKTSNLSDLTNVSTARTNLGLGTAATSAATAFDAAGAAANTTLNLPVNVMSANGTAVIGARNAVNASAGPIAVTMPTPTAVGQHIIIERTDSSATTANAITITGTIRGTPGTVVTLAAVGAANEGALYISESLTSWAIAGSIKPKAVLDTYYAPKPTGTPAAGTYVDGGTGAWTTLPSGGGGSAIEGLAAMKPPIGGAVFTSASGTSGQAPAIGTLDLGLLYVPGGTYNTAVCRVNSPIAGATVKMVAYKHDPTNILGTLLFETTAVAATSGGYLAITLPTALVVADPGYPIWFGLVNQGSAAANFWYGTAGIGLPYLVSAGGSADLNNTTPPNVRITGVTGAAPTSPTGVTIAPNVGAPRVALTRSA